MAKGVEQIVLNLKNFDRRKTERVEIAVQQTQSLVVAYAKGNHPYTDRTSNLTKSIAPGRVTVGRNSINGEVVANMEYAAYVERRWGGRYAYLWPAMKATQRDFFKLVKRALQ